MSKRAFQRRGAKRPPKAKFVIVCEGESTEPGYFVALGRHLALHRVDAIVSIIPIGVGGSPGAVAERAIKEKIVLDRERKRAGGSLLKRDEVWAVFDRDTHHDFDRALDLCRANGIGIARSNPCFELWLILHRSEFDAPGTSTDIQRACEKACPGYSRKGSKVADFEVLMESLSDAERRAHSQLSRRASEGKEFAPPSTTVHELTMRLRAT